MFKYAGPALRLIALAFFWWSAVVVIHYGSIGAGNAAPYGGNGGLVAFIAAFVVIAGLAFTERLLRIRVSFGVQEEKPKPRKTEAVEPEALRLKDMIALLDEDDLDDLRAEVREGLRDRIRNLTADESETFEDLLADAGTKRKRGTR
jgi:hypothetical protein